MAFGPPATEPLTVTSPTPGALTYPTGLQKLVEAMDAIYCRGRTIVSCLRSDTEDTGPAAFFALDNTADAVNAATMTLVWCLPYTLPDPLPGSGSQTGAGTGSTADARGALRLIARVQDCTATVRVYPLTLPDTLGTATTATTPGSAGVYSWQSADVLIPSGLAPGDLCAIFITITAAASAYAQCAGFSLIELPITDLTP